MGNIKVWIRFTRPQFFTAIILPIFFGGLAAYYYRHVFNLVLFILSLLVGLFLHAGTNQINDVYDFLSGGDIINKNAPSPFNAGSRILVEKLINVNVAKKVAISMFLISLLIASYLWLSIGLIHGLPVIIFALIGAISGYYYIAPPLRLAGRGIGELLVGLNFGVFATLGAYYVQVQALDLEPTLVSLILSFLIAAVLYINEFPDYEADKEVGKNTLVVRLGRDSAIKLFPLLVYVPYILVVLSVILDIAPFYLLISLAGLKWAHTAVKIGMKNYSKFPDILPANGNTILAHLITGILINVAYFLAIVYPIPNYLSIHFLLGG
ncbi:MAG: prenyltransferase [Candidatus Asgardarchaeia archaeon]